jgi:hypothetical protein
MTYPMADRQLINADKVLADYHAVVLDDGPHPVDQVYAKRNKIVIVTDSNITLMRDSKEKVLVEVIGDGQPPTSYSSYSPVYTRQFPRPA